jgi:hypothetical protein
LAKEVVRRKFPTQSGNIRRLVQARVFELVRKGALRRAGDRPGVVLGSDANGRSARSATGNVQPSKVASHRATAVQKRRDGSKRRGGQPPLRVVLTNLLRQSKQPVSGSELAERVRAAGYRTSSKSFAHVVWVMLGNMDNVEHVPGKGYRLKRSSA